MLRIGVDEVSYRKGHQYLTVVADHDQGGRVVWAAEGRNAQVLEGFYDELGEPGCARLQAISLDLGGAYQKATNTKAPHVRSARIRSTSSNWPTRRSTRPGGWPGTRPGEPPAVKRGLGTALWRCTSAAARCQPLDQAQPLGACQRR